MSVPELLGILRARWRVIVGTVLVCMALGAGLAAIQVPQYASSTRLFISTATDQSAEIYQGSLYSVQRVKSYEQLARSISVSREVASSLQTDESPAELQQKVSAQVLPETTVLEVTLADADPARAQALARGYAAVLVDTIAELETPEGQAKPLIQVKVIDDADLATSPFAPNWFLLLFMGTVLGLVLGLVLAVLRQLVDNKVRDPEAAGALIDTPVLSFVGQLKGGAAVEGDVHEAFRLLRTNLVFAAAARQAIVYVVSSPTPGDGKTTVAIELAKSLSLSGRKVLLIDADLRKPTVAPRTGLDSVPGLTSVLIGAVPFEEAVQTLEEWQLDVVTSGRIPPNPSELLAATVGPVLDRARELYDAVVVDAAPLLPVSDTSGLATHADGVLLVARYGSTTRRQLRLARERMDLVGVDLLGLVVNAAPARATKGYGYGYTYGSEQAIRHTGQQNDRANEEIADPGQRSRHRRQHERTGS